MAKTFTHAGLTDYKSKTIKVRFTNDVIAYTKGLERINFPPVAFIELPKPMTKLEAANWLLTNGNTTSFSDEDFKDAISRVIKRNTPKVPGAKRGRPRKNRPAANPTLD